MIEDLSKMMFEISYFQLNVNDWNNKKIKLLSLMKDRKLNFVDSNYTTYNYNIDDVELSENVKIILNDEINQIKNIFGFDEYYIDNSWFQEELNGMFHTIHNHGYGLSCVCYLEYDSNFHTPITFVSPYPDVFSGLCQYHTPSNVESGTIIFFPSVINHFTMPNKTDVSRKILSFNIKS